MSRLTSTRAFAKDVYAAWNAAEPSRLAAALAYYGMFSFAPMLYVALIVAEMFADSLATADHIFTRLAETLGYDTAEYIQQMVISASQRAEGGTTLSSLIGLVALLYAATGLFTNLKNSLNTIWQVPPQTQDGIMNFIKTRLLAAVMVLGVGLILILATFASLVTSVLTTFFDFGSDVVFGNAVSFVALSALSFAIIYRLMPDAKVAWRDVWLGALCAAVLFAIGRWGLGFYLSHSSIGSAFDAAGALAVVLIAIYYGAQILLFGAVFTKVYAARNDSTIN